MTISSRPPSKEYMENYDTIFRKNQQKKDQADQQSDFEPIWSDPVESFREEGE